MGIEGVGARMARKEDKRFITGMGRYVEDMVVPGMKHAAFGRSPHAHAKITGIDTSAARDMPGVIGVLTGPEIKGDGIGNLICGWMVHSKDGTPMKMGAWSPSLVQSVNLEHPCPGNPLGIKGCGEAGAIGSPPAVINAVTDAIGSNEISMPATPQKVWAALKAVTKH